MILYQQFTRQITELWEKVVCSHMVRLGFDVLLSHFNSAPFLFLLYVSFLSIWVLPGCWLLGMQGQPKKRGPCSRGAHDLRGKVDIRRIVVLKTTKGKGRRFSNTYNKGLMGCNASACGNDACSRNWGVGRGRSIIERKRMGSMWRLKHVDTQLGARTWRGCAYGWWGWERSPG